MQASGNGNSKTDQTVLARRYVTLGSGLKIRNNHVRRARQTIDFFGRGDSLPAFSCQQARERANPAASPGGLGNIIPPYPIQ